MPRYKIMVGAPSNGTLTYGSARALFTCSQDHDCTISDAQTTLGAFNTLWAAALSAGERGEFDLFAMLHADIVPHLDQHWLDILVEELDRYEADLVSAPVAIKDHRAVLSCGIGNPANPWQPFRRFTVEELKEMPPTFDAALAGYPGMPLLHNDGCWVCDLRKPVFYHRDERGIANASFDFRVQVRRRGFGDWIYELESEDWYFSRKLHEAGVKSYITSRVKLNHIGAWMFPNQGQWGEYKHGDEDTAHNWRKPEPAELARAG